jgi:diguanylate cyclase (GGDEF)-like protein
MLDRPRSAAPLAVFLAALLIGCGTAWADPVTVTAPDLPPGLPQAPSVTVNPDPNSPGVGVGIGDREVRLGTGPSGPGVTLDNRSPSSNRAPASRDPGSAVRAPILEPGGLPGPSRSGSGGPWATLFAPAATTAGANGSTDSSARAFPTRKPERASSRKADTGPGKSRLTPFFEVIEAIPAAVWAGLAALALIALALWLGWVRGRQRLAANAFVDPVTGIANSAAFMQLLEVELDRARRFKRPLGLLVVDVREHSREGTGLLHLGDTTLREATRAISDRIREADKVARLGPSRFAVISPEATAASSETVARALERRLEELRIHARVGVAERQATDRSAQDLVARAEAGIVAQPATGSDKPARRALRAA